MKKDKETILPVLLAGGKGTRLWPMSRESYPKQFSDLFDGKSLFQECALRVSKSSKLKFLPPITITNSDFRFIVSEQLCSVGIKPGPILLEPEGKNTAPAILAASIFALEHYDDPILLVTPTDHFIEDIKEFHEAIEKGKK